MSATATGARRGRPVKGSKRRNRSGNWELRLKGETYTIPESADWPDGRAQAELDFYVAQARAGVFRGFPNTREAPTDARGRLFSEAAEAYAQRVRKDSKGKRPVAHGTKPGNLNDKEWRVRHLLSFFADKRIGEIDLDLIHEYQEKKQEEAQAIRANRERIKAKKKAAKEERRKAGLATRSIRDPEERALALAAADEKQRAALTPEEAQWWKDNCNRKGLDASSINKTIQTLGTILEAEMKRYPGVLPFNWARDEEVRLGEGPPDDFALNLDQLEAFLEAARSRDQLNRPNHSMLSRETMFAFMIFTGARISEAMAERLRDIDRHNGHTWIRGTKTKNAKDRRVPIHPGLKPILWRYLDEVAPGRDPNDLLFVTTKGKRRTKDRFNDLIDSVIPHANKLLEARRQLLLPDHFTSHAFRRTYVTMLAELGENEGVAIARVGHESAKLTHEIYNQVAKTGRMANDPRLVALLGERGYDGFEKDDEEKAA